jgi:hypothetical protein
MPAKNASEKLVGFVEHILHDSAQKERQLTVGDLPVEIRAERHTEYSDWTCRDLDLIEQEGALHRDDTLLAALLS